MPTHSLNNPLLVKTKDLVETHLPEELKEPVNRVVIAGQRLLYSPETHESLVQPVYAELKQANFPPDQIATGMVNLLGILFQASKGGMKVEAAFPAGVILLMYVLADLEQLYGLKVTPELLKSIGQAMGPLFAKAFGIQQESEGAPEQPGLANTAAPEEMPPAAPEGAMAP